MNSRNAWAKRALERERAKRGGLCQNNDCPFLNREVQFAHLTATGFRGRGRGRKERLMDIRRHPAAYVLLCRDCHHAFDKQGMEIILTIREEVA